MKKTFRLSVLILGLFTSVAQAASGVLEIPFKGLDGKTHTLAEYKGKAILVVNTASHCGYTGQYKGLQALHTQYKDKGLVIVGFPSQSFGQEFKKDDEVATFCQRNYGVKFPMASVVDVAGPQKHPLFKALIESSGEKGEIKWNFEKFLLDKSGQVQARFSSSVEPEAKELKDKLEVALKN